VKSGSIRLPDLAVHPTHLRFYTDGAHGRVLAGLGIAHGDVGVDRALFRDTAFPSIAVCDWLHLLAGETQTGPNEEVGGPISGELCVVAQLGHHLAQLAAPDPQFAVPGE
jgi:hypothetical protein